MVWINIVREREIFMRSLDWPSIPGLSYLSLHLNQFPINKHWFVFIMELFTTAESWNQPQCPSRNEWKKKASVCACSYLCSACVHTCMCAYYLVLRKNDATCFWNKPFPEGLILYLSSHMCNLDFFTRHKSGEAPRGKWRGPRGEKKWEKKS